MCLISTNHLALTGCAAAAGLLVKGLSQCLSTTQYIVVKSAIPVPPSAFRVLLPLGAGHDINISRTSRPLRPLVRTDKPFQLSASEAKRVVNAIRSMAVVVDVSSHVSICRDEPDNRVLECAIDGQAGWIITGDQDLLALQAFRGVKIGSVADFFSDVEEQLST